MIDWKTKLTSRKLWIAITGFVSMLLLAFGIAENTVTQVTAIVMAGAELMAYIIAEGLVDAKAASDTVIVPAVEHVEAAEGADM
ncbi:MAG: hypothetical protein IKY90_07425 [Oscillospiraceae bacterium]|nr:hypothetical protein [Oscillospiraceae bacterium]